MKNEAITHMKTPAIQEASLDDLFKEMSEWSDRIAQRAYELFTESGFTNGHDREDWFQAEQQLLKPVALEVKDTKDELIVTAEVPGFEAKDLEIRLNGSHLVIEGKHETTEDRKEKGRAVYSERKSEQICRMVDLPAAVLADKAQAELKNGVLELKLRKAGPKPITVAAA